MRVGIPLLADRVAPRCTFADSVLVVDVRGRRIQDESTAPLNGTTWADLAETLSDHRVDTLICGGISPSTRESIRSREVQVIENVAGTKTEVLEALRKGRIRSGFGLGSEAGSERGNGGRGRGGQGAKERDTPDAREPVRGASPVPDPSDCLECRTKVCLQGEACPYLDIPETNPARSDTREVLESTWDVALEEERTLCRLAELVYFALEMGYRRVGVAFCEELREPASILTGVLRRFFEVVAIGCKVRGEEGQHPTTPSGTSESGEEGRGVPAPAGAKAPCNPLSMAAAMNEKGTDLNVLVGLCVGADAVFSQNSDAPVTTIFVKDKSLANNPIGAVYSHYHLEDI